MARTPEGKVKDKVKEMLKRHGIWFFMPVQSGYGIGGIADFVCCAKGWFIAIECKARKGQPLSPLQLKCKEEVEASGGKWFLVYDDATLLVVDTFIKIM